MNLRARVALALVVFAAACNEGRGTAPAPTAGPATASAPSPATASTALTEEPTSDTWLAVRKGGTELGLVELRKAQPPKLELSVQSPEADALRTKLDAIDGPEGIHIDMHLPPESGEGRGPYGSALATYDSPLYRHALEQALEPTYDVRELPALREPLPPQTFRRLVVSHDGVRVGAIDFGSNPIAVTTEGDKAATLSLKNEFERLAEPRGVAVRFHYPKDGRETLVRVEAKSGDASFAHVATLYLMVERYYLKRHGYALAFEP
jgi:hypothetical protein